MAEKSLRIALVGAATLLGKALNDELSASAFASADFRLMDDEDALGKLAAAADEVTFIQRIEADSFDGCGSIDDVPRPGGLEDCHWSEKAAGAAQKSP